MDSEKSITYRLVAGDVDKFIVDPVTGEVTMIKLHTPNSFSRSYGTHPTIFDLLIVIYPFMTFELLCDVQN